MKSLTVSSVEKLLKDYIHDDGTKYIDKKDYEAVSSLVCSTYDRCGVEIKGYPGKEYLSFYRLTAKSVKEAYKIELR